MKKMNKQGFADLQNAIKDELEKVDLIGADLPKDYRDDFDKYKTSDDVTMWQALVVLEEEEAEAFKSAGAVQDAMEDRG